MSEQCLSNRSGCLSVVGSFSSKGQCPRRGGGRAQHPLHGRFIGATARPPRLRPARLRAPLVGGSCPSPGMADTGRVAPPPAVASAAHTPTTPLRWRHTAVHVAKQRSCDPNGRPNGFPMDSQWIFNGFSMVVFLVSFLLLFWNLQGANGFSS